MRGLIGSYTKAEGQGIYAFELNDKKINNVIVAAESADATYLTVAGDYVYAVYRENGVAGVRTFKIVDDSLKLEQVGECLNGSDSGCYLAVVGEGKYLVDSGYASGEIRLYAIEDGIVTSVLDTFQIEGNGPHERQDAAHAHFVDATPDGKYIVAVDLGADKVVTIKIEDERLVFVSEYVTPAGSGPRHIRFSPCGRYAYVFTELSNEIIVLGYEGGEFEPLATYSTLPADFDGHSQGAAVRLSDGYLYASNRGHNSIAVFELIDGGADLKLVEIEQTRGDWPRDFNITPDGKTLVVAHERSHELSVFEIGESGQLTFMENASRAHEGVFVTFV